MPKKRPLKIVEKVDEQLVDSVLTEIQKLYHEKSHETVYAIGQCLCDHFYEGDIEKIRNNEPLSGRSLTRLSRRCEEEVTGLSTAWLYASVNLLVDRKDLDGVWEYEQLSVSHKHALLQVKDIKSKKLLALDIHENKMPVRKAIGYIRKYLDEHPDARISKKKEEKMTLLKILDRAGDLEQRKYQHLRYEKNMDKLTDTQLDKVKQKAILKLHHSRIQKMILDNDLKQIDKVLGYFRKKESQKEYEDYLAQKRKEIAEEYKVKGKINLADISQE